MPLIWKTSFSRTDWRIFREKQIIGILKLSIWKNEGYGELHGHLLRFKKKNFWKHRVTIFDIDGKKELGEIRFTLFRSVAEIEYEEVIYHFKFEKWTRRRWSVTGPDGEIATFASTRFWKNEGEIEFDFVSPAVVLAGLFASAYFRKIGTAG